ncbi:hypothetical protein GCM10012288_01990 [Malaciobacter pacificus]|uniref:Campylo_MOMP domain-containing protein n=1 Tax=Malaciobacter pacificus TaxID=1080223 RepID=A0A5C2H8B6_9BACT|nr:major outer membrane protein [Malaciobacter pacificus]QEP33456.1 Campylo_MOMP domain-containing protein [Malaciobacter pacificus]GGD31631.1 hypothetical protein GCM10012288_01990 [Malaciobacter pacificus]
MKKIAKMSLVAAVAVAGFSTTASAGALEDAIKNTSILGYATYRYDDRSIDNTNFTDTKGKTLEDGTVVADGNEDDYNNTTNNKHKIAVGLISKINDDLSYTYVGAVTGTSDTTSEGVDYMGGNFYTVYSYFTYTGINNLTINVGQQTINTPQTDTYDDIGQTQEGTGITAVANVGPVTLVGGFMNQTKLSGEGVDVATGAEDLAVVAVMTKLGGVALDANFIDLKDFAESYTFGAKTSLDLGGVSLSPYARYTSLELDSGEEQALYYVGTKLKAGAFGANVSYTATGKDGGLVAFDDDAEAVNQGWALNLNTLDVEGDMIKLNASYAITSSISAAINHNMMNNDTTDLDSDETYGQLTWKPSKNFYAYARYGVVNQENAGAADTEAQRGRLHFTYMF